MDNTVITTLKLVMVVGILERFFFTIFITILRVRTTFVCRISCIYVGCCIGQVGRDCSKLFNLFLGVLGYIFVLQFFWWVRFSVFFCRSLVQIRQRDIFKGTVVRSGAYQSRYMSAIWLNEDFGFSQRTFNTQQDHMI